MDAHLRRMELLKLLADHQTASVDQLVTWLKSSPATVRRHIGWLAQRNQLKRVRGGVEHLPQNSRGFSLASKSFVNSIEVAVRAKRAIARHAASMCCNGETVIIHGGTTTFNMTEFLEDKQLKILTDSFPIAKCLLETSANEIIVTGGRVYREQNVILTPFETEVTQYHYASKMFTGADGLSLLGLMERDPAMMQAKKRLLSQTDEVIVLADSSKFSSRNGLVVCGLDRITSLITDTGVSASTVRLLEQAGVRVVTVAPDDLDQPTPQITS